MPNLPVPTLVYRMNGLGQAGRLRRSGIVFGAGVGGGSDGYPPSRMDPGMGGTRDPIKPWHDEISYQAQHTTDVEREVAEAGKPLPSRLIRRFLRYVRGLF